jgi:hypothetical protein
MSICSVPNCKFQSEVKFHSPRNEQQLSLWKRILSIGEDKFMVCESHFGGSFWVMKVMKIHKNDKKL